MLFNKTIRKICLLISIFLIFSTLAGLARSEIPLKSNKIQQTSYDQTQDGWIFLQEINNPAQNSYLKRNATYYFPVSSTYVGTVIWVYFAFRNQYSNNDQYAASMLAIVMAPNGTIVTQKTIFNFASFSFVFKPGTIGMWKVIVTMDFSYIIPIDTSNLAEASVDVQMSVQNFQTAVKCEVNEYQSWTGNHLKVLTLRSKYPDSIWHFFVNQLGTYSLSTFFANNQGIPSIQKIIFYKDHLNSTIFHQINFSQVTDITNPILRQVTFATVQEEGTWIMDIEYTYGMDGSAQELTVTDSNSNYVNFYLNPTGNFFIDNNYDGVNDFANLSTNQVITTTSVPFYLSSIMFCFLLLPFLFKNKIRFFK